MSTTIIVTGGPTFMDRELVYRTLDHLRDRDEDLSMIVGRTRGVGALAAEWAVTRGVPLTSYPVDRRMNGRKAGRIRNRLMLKALLAGEGGRLVGVLAFPGGYEAAHMVSLAARNGVEVWYAAESVATADTTSGHDRSADPSPLHGAEAKRDESPPRVTRSPMSHTPWG